MGKTTKEAYQQRLDRLSGIFADIVRQADEQSLYICPYKNKDEECTAQFSCRNQQKSKLDTILCNGDNKLDYRTAWESTKFVDDSPPEDHGEGHILCDILKTTSSVNLTLFDAADKMRVEIPTSCHRSGSCHECIVEILKGEEGLSKKTESEKFLDSSFRLACQTHVIDSNINIDFSPLNRTPKILVTSKDTTPAELIPCVTLRDDSVCIDGEVVDRYRGNILGIAIDLGTTTLAMELVDLENGKILQTASFENPQRFGGSDVMYRISFDETHPGELRRAIVRSINRQIELWCDKFSFTRQFIYEIIIAGNSTMRDLLFRIDVQSIGQKPYKSLIELEALDGKRNHTAISSSTKNLGLRINPRGRAYGLPIIASHVGGDAAADLCALGLDKNTPHSTLLVDVGTNTEVIGFNKGRIVAASCPAGPAFEGGNVSHGMPGYEGAIESLYWNVDKWNYNTIGELSPQGICGSGLIDLLAELRRHSIMNSKGAFTDKRKELTIIPEQNITFSRLDASNLAQAKAANYCGQYIVLRSLGINPADLDKLYLAGGFANYVNVKSAIDIGFLPPVPQDRIVKVGNTSLVGARHVLLSSRKRSNLESLTKEIDHIELETTPDFFDLFVDGCQFKPMPEKIN